MEINMARFKFFLGANPELGEDEKLKAEFIAALKGTDFFPEHLVDICARIDSNSDDCAEAICESGERIYELEFESAILDEDEAHEALCYTMFEGGSMHPDLRFISLSA
jgi:hypothetical protein